MFQTTNQHIIYVPASWPQVDEGCQEDGSTNWKSNARLKHLTRVLPWENHGKHWKTTFMVLPANTQLDLRSKPFVNLLIVPIQGFTFCWSINVHHLQSDPTKQNWQQSSLVVLS